MAGLHEAGDACSLARHTTGENTMNTQTLSRIRTWSGIMLVLATGLIHGVEGPAHYHEATYQGLLFFLNAAGALVAARGIYRCAKLWGWTLGALISAGAFTLYIVSRTIGLPGLEIDDDWFEPLGVASLLVEGLYVLVYASVMTRPTLHQHRLSTGGEHSGSSPVSMNSMSHHVAQRPHVAPDA
jgi:hypothetical protein